MDNNLFLVQLSESDRTDFGRVDFAKQSEVQQVFSAIWALESEVNNGGFEQYFLNLSGEEEQSNFAPAALRRIGAEQCASIVERALQVVSKHPLPDDEASEKLMFLDAEFFFLPGQFEGIAVCFCQFTPRRIRASRTLSGSPQAAPPRNIRYARHDGIRLRHRSPLCFRHLPACDADFWPASRY